MNVCRNCGGEFSTPNREPSSCPFCNSMELDVHRSSVETESEGAGLHREALVESSVEIGRRNIMRATESILELYSVVGISSKQEIRGEVTAPGGTEYEVLFALKPLESGQEVPVE